MPEEASPGPEAAFYFTTPALTQRLELIRHLIDHSDRLLLVIGERQSGKTTLADQVLARAPDTWLVTRFHANPMLDSRLLLRDLAVAIGANASGADSKALTEAIGAILRQREQHSLISVLFVDDAHVLPADALKLLFARGCSKPGALRVVLLCEPHINTILEAPELQSLRETIVHILDMPSFTLEQTRAYLDARYNHSGLASSLPLDGTEVARIHGGSAGSPGRIDRLMRQTLKQPPPAESEHEESSARIGSLAKHPWRLNTVAALLATVSIIIAIDSLQDRLPHLPSEDPAPIELSPPKQAPLAPPATARPQPPKTNQPKLKSSPAAPRAGENTRIEPVLTLPRPLPPEQYVLQLLAIRDPAAGERFLVQHQLGGRARVVAIRRKGQTWYLVVLGPFPDRRAASAAVRTLPKAIQAQQPWPRRIADLEAGKPAAVVVPHDQASTKDAISSPRRATIE
ncbi:MAG: AAA family ATPase [Gammaproteobacteria bacterium]|nr:AAA family ATPase [Gammaproteobacteria bacterium]